MREENQDLSSFAVNRAPAELCEWVRCPLHNVPFLVADGCWLCHEAERNPVSSESVEDYERKSPGAGNSSTEGPEPSSQFPRNNFPFYFDGGHQTGRMCLEIDGSWNMSSDGQMGPNEDELRLTFTKVRSTKNNGFEYWKLDGEGVAVELGQKPSTKPPSSVPSPSSFSVKTIICGIEFEVTRDGKHANLHVYIHDGEILDFWTFEPLDTAIPKLEAILGAARLAADA